MRASSIRIVTWNCNQGLTRKADHLLALEPDIAVVCEAGKETELGDGSLRRVAWSGHSPSKGLAVFTRDGIEAEIEPSWDPSRQHFLPLHVGQAAEVDLLAVWAMNHRSEEPRPKRGRTLAALQHYEPFLARGRAVVIGDFNNNARWDSKAGAGFTPIVEELTALGYASVYHSRTGEVQGRESTASYFHLKRPDRPYLIDHAFVPDGWLSRVRGFVIGDAAEWLPLSDHTPLILDLATAVPAKMM